MSAAGPGEHTRSIVVRGARVNDLRGVDVDIPKRQLVVVTGVSGSGKSSLAFDTVAAESQRLLNETYPAFVQNLMPHLPRPDVDQPAGALVREDLDRGVEERQAALGIAHRSSPVPTASLRLQCQGAHD